MLILANGNLLTQDPRNPHAQALAIRNGRIVCCGDTDDLVAGAPAGTRVIDLSGRAVVPGFNDAHVHVWKVGHLLTSMVDLRPARSLREIKDKIQAAASKVPPGA